jgi:hypothetical protein
LELRLLLFVLGDGIVLNWAENGQPEKDDQNGPNRFPHTRIYPYLILGLACRKVKNWSQEAYLGFFGLGPNVVPEATELQMDACDQGGDQLRRWFPMA